MLYVFLDESGDLGPNPRIKGTSRFFVLTALLCSNKRPIEKLVTKIRRNAGKKMRYVSELHATNLRNVDCLRFCRQIVNKNVIVNAGYIDKSKHDYSRIDKHVLYSDLVRHFLADCLEYHAGTDRIVILSRRETNQALNARLIRAVRNSLLARGIKNVDIRVKRPDQEKALQAADIVSWAIFQQLEFRNSQFVQALASVLLTLRKL